MSESNLAERSDGRERLVSGAKVVAQALKTQDVNYMFGIVGIPVTEIALAAQEVGIRYIGMRNEQAVSREFALLFLAQVSSMLWVVEACRLYSKFSARPSSIEAIPSIIEKAVRSSIYGRPGACYVDIPADFVNLQVNVNSIRNAKQPLLIIGKGAAYARAEESIRKLVEQCKLPFLPTPMGKGVIPDNHPNCVGAARSRYVALQILNTMVWQIPG
eukprot:bmy_19900T0